MNRHTRSGAGCHGRGCHKSRSRYSQSKQYPTLRALSLGVLISRGAWRRVFTGFRGFRGFWGFWGFRGFRGSRGSRKSGGFLVRFKRQRRSFPRSSHAHTLTPSCYDRVWGVLRFLRSPGARIGKSSRGGVGGCSSRGRDLGFQESLGPWRFSVRGFIQRHGLVL